MKPYRRSVVLSLLLLVALTALTSVRSHATPAGQLQAVGSTTLKVMFWTIYHSTLYTDDGEYRGIVPGLALEIEYRRNIRRDQLISTTRDQWRELGLYHPEESELWLKELADLWPDIRRGDSITLVVEADRSAAFFHNEQFLGRIQDIGFTDTFLAIWLAENTSFPDLRDQLIGQSG